MVLILENSCPLEALRNTYNRVVSRLTAGRRKRQRAMEG